MVYVGIDLGLLHTGVVLFYKDLDDHWQCDETQIRTLEKGITRIQYVRDGIEDIFESSAVLGDGFITGIEAPAFGAKWQAHQLGELHGVVKMWMYEEKYPEPYLFAPTTVKKFATGKGNTPKDLMIKRVFQQWGFDTDSEHIADAYAVARLTRAVHETEHKQHLTDDLKQYQVEVVQRYLFPPKKRIKREKKLDVKINPKDYKLTIKQMKNLFKDFLEVNRNDATDL